MNSIEIEKLRKWFLENKRDLPWREDPTPYRVWVSEIMLQQTQVSVVIPYFESWMKLFPTLESLARAPLDSVIKAWEGLGYYSRARNLHAGAQFIMANYQGELPNCKEKLKKIKGIGEYTAGAIRSFAFRERAAAVDGNVIRVLCRYYSIQDDISKIKTQKNLRSQGEEILPKNEPWVIAEALIELGAKVCSKNPKCLQCPLKSSCKAFNTNQENKLPYKSAKIEIQEKHRFVFAIFHKGCFLIKKEEKGKIMSDLHEFPYVEYSISTDPQEIYKKTFEISCQQFLPLPTEKHSFTKYRVRLSPFLVYANETISIDGYHWKTITEIKKLAFSSGHRRILSTLLEIVA